MEESSAVRLDTVVHDRHPEFSRAQVQRLIKDGLVRVNGLVQTKNGFSVKPSSSVDITLPDNVAVASLDLPVLYEDDDCVVLDKPVGVLTHSKGAFNLEATVASWLAGRHGFSFAADSGNARLGIVHRLDRATSGVIICAKHPAALKHLQKQFQDRKAKKTYIARISGQLKQPEALIDLPVERNPKSPQRFRVGQNGKAAQTVYTVLETVAQGTSFDSLLELKPVTGRTHQLRVHLDYLGHPIVGDTFYGGREASRLYLHAHRLEITLPNKNRQTFSADIPHDFYKENI